MKVSVSMAETFDDFLLFKKSMGLSEKTLRTYKEHLTSIEKHLPIDTVDCSNGQIDPMTNAFIQMSGVFAELELRIIRERVRSGMANAKAKGAKIGRPHTTTDAIPPIFYRHYPAFKSGNLNLSEFARVCGLSRNTIYKYLSLLEY